MLLLLFTKDQSFVKVRLALNPFRDYFKADISGSYIENGNIALITGDGKVERRNH